MHKFLAILLSLAFMGSAAVAENIPDGMCASKLLIVSTRHTGEDDQALTNACVRFVDEQTKATFKGNPGNDIVWWKDRHGAFVIAKCTVIGDKSVVYIASHHLKNKFACPSIDSVWNLISPKVAAGL